MPTDETPGPHGPAARPSVRTPTCPTRQRRLPGVALRARPGLQGRQQPADGRGAASPRSPGPTLRTAGASTWPGCAVTKVSVNGGARRPLQPSGRASWSIKLPAAAAGRGGVRSSRSATAGPPGRRAGLGRRRLGGADRRRAGRRPAQRRAVLVPLQRPPQQQGQLPDRSQHRAPYRAWPTASSSRRTAAREPGPRGPTSSRADGDLPGHRCRSAGTSWRRWPRTHAGGAACSAGAVPDPRLRPATSATTFGRQPQMMKLFVELFGPYPLRPATPSWSPTTIWRSRSRRRASRSSAPTTATAGGSAERLIAHELAHQWFGNSLTVGRWQRHLAARGLRLLRRVAVVRGVRRPAPTSAHGFAWAQLSEPRRRTCCWRPGPADMFDDRVYKRGALTLHALRLHLGDDAVLRAAAGLDGRTPARHRHLRALPRPGRHTHTRGLPCRGNAQAMAL